MKTNELIKKIEEDGWYLFRQAKGSHSIYRHPIKKNLLTIPVHPGKEIPTGTCKAIIKQAGIK